MIPDLEQERMEVEAERSNAQARLQEVEDARQQVDQLEQAAPAEARRPGGFLKGFLRFTVSLAKVVMEAVLPPHLQAGLQAAGKALQSAREHHYREGLGAALEGAAGVVAPNDASAAHDLSLGARVVQGTLSEADGHALTVRGFRQSVAAGIAGAAVAVYGRREGAEASAPPPTTGRAPGDQPPSEKPAVDAADVSATGAPTGVGEDPVALDEREPLRDEDEVTIQATFSFEQVQAMKERFEAEQSALEMRLRIAEHRLAEIERRLAEAPPDAHLEEDDDQPPPDRDSSADGRDRAQASAEQLHRIGVPAQELSGVHSLGDLLLGGYTLDELLDSDWPIEDLVHEGGFSAGQLVDAGVPVDALRQHFELRQLVDAVPLQQLHEGGILAADLLASGCVVADLAAAGYTLRELVYAHASFVELAQVFPPDALATEVSIGEAETTDPHEDVPPGDG